MRKSIRGKLFGFMSCLVVLVIVFGWLINSLFLERFYCLLYTSRCV